MAEGQACATSNVASDQKPGVLWFDDEIGKIQLRASEAAYRRAFRLRGVVTPNELLAALDDPDARFDVLLVDLIVQELTSDDARLIGIAPRVFGLELKGRLRAGRLGERWKELPVVFLTASTFAEDLRNVQAEVKQDERARLIRKPTQSTYVINVVKELVSLSDRNARADGA